ncbi:MAG: hypothetical protein CM1200mP22_31320 [Dehalococcoidia bacterium]|nr:MAG: hypothetical protein CM1200mP22_31320 [Dehalococcoidia bacterium]
MNPASIGPQGNRGGSERFPMTAPFPSQVYSSADHDLGHGGQNTIYENTGARPYRDTWHTVPGVDEYYRMTNEKKQKKYAASTCLLVVTVAGTSVSSLTLSLIIGVSYLAPPRRRSD